MKTIQTFVLLILLFAARTYSLGVIGLDLEKGSIGVELLQRESSDDLVAVPDKRDLKRDSVPLQENQTEEVALDIQNTEEETQTLIPQPQETVPIDLELPPVEQINENPENLNEASSTKGSPVIQETKEDIAEVAPVELDSVPLVAEASTNGPAENPEEGPNSLPSQETATKIQQNDVKSSDIIPEEPESVPEQNTEVSTESPVEKLAEKEVNVPENQQSQPAEEILKTLDEKTDSLLLEETSTQGSLAIQQGEEDISVVVPEEPKSVPEQNTEASTESPVEKHAEEEVKVPENQQSQPADEILKILNEKTDSLPLEETSTQGSLAIQQGEENISVVIPEEQESRPSTEAPTEISKIIEEERKPATLSESGAQSGGQVPLETITCVCDCGIESNLPQTCDDTPSETPTENEASPANEEGIPSEASAKTVESVKNEQTVVPSVTEAPLDPITEPTKTVPAVPEQKTTPDQVTTEATDITSTTISPCTEIGDFPDVSDCRKFISCSGNSTDILTQSSQCPERSAFNPELRRCTRDLSPCLDEEPICLRPSSLPNPNGDNSSYIWCVPSLLGGYHKYLILCSQNEVFVPLLGRCWPEAPQLAFGLGGWLDRGPNDRDMVRAELKLLKKEIKEKAKEEKLRKKMEEKARLRAEKLAAKEIKKQKTKKVDDDDSEDEEDDD